MIGQRPLDGVDRHGAAVVQQHLLGRLVRRDVAGGGDGVVALEDPLHLALGDEAQDKDHDQGQHDRLIADVDA